MLRFIEKIRAPLSERECAKMFLCPPVVTVRNILIAIAFLVGAILLVGGCLYCARRCLAPQVEPSDVDSCCALWPRSQWIALS